MHFAVLPMGTGESATSRPSFGQLRGRNARRRKGRGVGRVLVLMATAVLGAALVMLACSPPGRLVSAVAHAVDPHEDGALQVDHSSELKHTVPPACAEARAAIRSMLLYPQAQGDEQLAMPSPALAAVFTYMQSTGCPMQDFGTDASLHILAAASAAEPEVPLKTRQEPSPSAPSSNSSSNSSSSPLPPPPFPSLPSPLPPPPTPPPFSSPPLADPSSSPTESKQRGRRDALMTGAVLACRLSSLLQGTCGRPQTGSLQVLNVTFDAEALSPDNPISRTAAEANLRDYGSTVQPTQLVLFGHVVKHALDFFLSSGNWSSITHIGIHGYDSAAFHMDLLSPLQSLTSVDLNDNDLRSLTTLEDASRTASGAVTPALTRLLTNIISLSLHNNHLEASPKDVLRHTPALATLDLSENQIHALRRDDFQALERTTTLNLRANLIEEVEEGAFRGLPGLLHLDLSSNNIQRLSETVFAPLQGLLTLDLSSNPISTLPPGLLHPLTALTDFVLTRTEVAALPEGIFSKNTQLTSLALHRNRLTSVPVSTLHGLSKLNLLYFALNSITHFYPDTFRDQAKLEFLYLHNNPLGEVPPDLLAPCKRLRSLQLQQAMLTALHPQFFASQTRLDSLFLDGNELTRIEPELLRAPSTTLTVLFLSRNRLATFDVAMPSLLQIDLSANPIANNLRDLPALLPRLNTFRMRNHRISRLDLTSFLRLGNLTLLDLSLEPPLSSTAVVDAASVPATTSDDGASGDSDVALRARRLQRLHMTYIGFGPNVLPALHALGTSLNSLYMGWPGMDEDSVPVARLCALLMPTVSEFGLRNTGYRELTLCSTRNFKAVFLQDNQRLTRVSISTGLLEQLNVSYSAQLQELNVPPVQILDISGTRVQAQRALCSTLGSRMLFARRMPGTHFEGVESVRSLMRRCLQRVDLVDLSDNKWLDSPRALATVTSKITLLREADFLSVDVSQRLSSRATPPMLVLERLPLSCSLRLTITRVRELANKDDVVSELGYLFHCECQRRFHLTGGGRCAPDQMPVGVIVGAAVGGAAGLAVICAGVYLLWRLITRIVREREQYKYQKEQGQRLLAEKDEEVIALKKAWEIEYDELRFAKALTAGAYGSVYRGEWDTLTVAIKVLKENLMELDETSVETFEKEVDFLQRTRHPNLVRFFGAGTNPTTGAPFLVLEFVALGSLKDLLDQKHGGLQGVLAEYQERKLAQDNAGCRQERGGGEPPRTEQRMAPAFGEQHRADAGFDETKTTLSTVWDLKLRLLKDVARGMAFIHSLDNVHRDLKSGNVLVSTNLHAKITDFGTIRRCFKGSASSAASSAIASRATATTNLGLQAEYGSASANMTTEVGTPLYMAPEVLTTDTYSSKADVYSFGVLMWEVAMEREPDLIEQELGNAGVSGPLGATLIMLHDSGASLKFPDDEAGSAIPAWYKHTSTSCMAADPKTRPTFATLKDNNLRVHEESES